MTSETKHTPWVVVDTHMESSILDSRGYIVCVSSEEYPVPPSLPEMQHIVKCVNMHDELVEALKDIIDRSYNDPLGTSKVLDMRKIAEKALKKAGAL